MVALVFCFAALIFVAGGVLLLRPETLLALLEKEGDSRWLYGVAVATRLLLGLLLLYVAGQSKFPLLIGILGWIALAAAIGLAALGPLRFGRLVRWIVARLRVLAPLGGLLAMAFGIFLFYAFT